MRELVTRGNGIDIRAYEIAPVDQIAGELQPATLTLLRAGKGLLGDVLESCRQVSESDWVGDERTSAVWSTSYLPFERAIDATMANLGSHQAVDEIAFVAQLELRQREERLDRVRASQGPVVLLGECDSSLRRIRKALNAVEAAIAKVEGVPPLLDFTSELQTSLAVRRAYAKFRARLLADGEPSSADLRGRLRGAGTQIAKLVGWEVYPDMRVQDRLLLRELQKRILDWLRGGTEATTAAGMRVWQDLAGCVEMFSLVNRRQELVEHDSALLRELTDVLADDHTAPALATLRALEGLDPELDALIAAPPLDRGALRGVIARLAAKHDSGPARTSGGDVPW